MDINTDLKNINLKEVANLPDKVKLIIISVLGVLSFLLIFMVFSIPQMSKLSRIKREERDLKVQLVQVAPKSLAFKDQEKQLLKLEKMVKERNNALPTAQQMSDILASFTKTAVNNQLNIVLLKPQASKQGDYYITTPIEMKVSGSYNQLAKFINQISASDYLFNLRKIDINLSQASQNESSGSNLTMSVISDIYYFSPKPPSLEKTKKGAAHGSAH